MRRSLRAFSSYERELASDGILGGVETTGAHCCKLVLERRGKHVWEELDGDREQELHKRNHDKDGKRNYSE